VPVALAGRAPRWWVQRRWILAGCVACAAAIGLLVATIVSDAPLPPPVKPRAPAVVAPLPQRAAPPPAKPTPPAPARAAMPVDVPIVHPPREVAPTPELRRPVAPKPRAAAKPKDAVAPIEDAAQAHDLAPTHDVAAPTRGSADDVAPPP
jgi:hypothetical protein